MNAFATGSNPQNAAVAATTGLLAVMNREELEAVIGHEVSHIRNYDIRISTIAVALASAITMLSSIGGRMMWWGGSRSRDDDREGGSGLEIIILILSILAIILAPLAATLVQIIVSPCSDMSMMRAVLFLSTIQKKNPVCKNFFIPTHQLQSGWHV